MKYSAKEVHEQTSIYCWWTLVTSRLYIEKITWLIINFTKMSANFITIIGFFATFVIFYFLLEGQYLYALIFYVFTTWTDTIDGTVARLKKQTSFFGHVLDLITDRLKTALCTFGLLYTGYELNTERVLPVVLYYVVQFFFIYFNTFYVRIRDDVLNKDKRVTDKFRKRTFDKIEENIKNYSFPKRVVLNFMVFLKKRRINVTPNNLDTDALVFVVAPIAGYFSIVAYAGSGILVFMTCITIIMAFKMKNSEGK